MNEPHVEVFRPLLYAGPADLATAQGACEMALELGEAARRCFNDKGLTPPLWAVIATWDLTRLRAYERPAGLLMEMPDRTGTIGEQIQAKNVAASFMRSVIEQTKAIGIVTVNEMWFVSEESGMDGAKRQAEKYPDLSLHPDRREGIWLALEHFRLKNVFARRADITRNALGKGTAAPFANPWPGAKSVYKGRFTDLLRKSRLN